MPLMIPRWAERLLQVVVAVGASVIALATWTYTRGRDEASAAGAVGEIKRRLDAHVANDDVHFRRSDAERLARVEEGVNELKRSITGLAAAVERKR